MHRGASRGLRIWRKGGFSARVPCSRISRRGQVEGRIGLEDRGTGIQGSSSGSYELGFRFRPRPRPSTEPTQPLTHHPNPQAKHAGLPARPQAPRPAASTAAARLRRLAAPDAHPAPPAVHRPDAVAPPVRPPRRHP